MKPALILLFGFMLCVCSCKTINIATAQTKTTQQVILGSISADKEFIFQKEINHSAIPSYNVPIKLMVTPKIFTKQSYKAYAKAQGLQPYNINVKYVDSLPEKPKYIQLQIADKVTLLKALNGEENNGIKDYISHNKYANVLTSISMALNKQDLVGVLKAESLFLVENGYKTYALQLYNDGKKGRTIAFNQGVVFEYKATNCCWQENKKHDIDIVDLVGGYASCPNNTYRSASRAKKQINPYKL
ncbi:hypothetical protein [Seonamhaeicola maritimus]|uniref:Lipoprotein n=1 Tax=Seonamhaeicola maritimus TaxID=2591822 RepID=A0A5C7GE00_9FLAO|nr:hypothetical protein [Seonamhaeicola maritimus]TXG34845.1 hypothetical protein FUA22_17235 [Seonamhaeicola maritimus]